jgi:hypothetical protein
MEKSMNTLREAAQQALAEPDHKDLLIEQLEETNLWQAKRIAELLAEPQEPVQVPEGYKLVPVSALQWLFGEAGEFECPPERYFRGKSPTYWWRSVFRGLIEAAPEAPQPRRRLTDEEKNEMWTNATISPCTHMQCYLRGIEDAEDAFFGGKT